MRQVTAHRFDNSMHRYWFGNANPDTGRNLATCKYRVRNIRDKYLTIAGIWGNRAEAMRGGAGQGHRQAMRATVGLYTEWKFERLDLVVQDGGREWDIVEWHD